jgi:tRNA pseudouridine55 synthase
MTVSGILNVNKPRGLTSHRIVALVRKSSGVAKVGHAGTLDPLATGVLVVLLGRAARVSEYVMALPKVYRSEITLGQATTTFDAEGDVTSTAPVEVSEERVRTALASFLGDIQQTPPPFSAAKVRGERAYRLAREGRPVALAPRPAHVHRIELLKCEPPKIEIEVECGKGTYIRSLAHDLGQTLGCGAFVSSLTRTRVGPFDIESAVDVASLESALADGTWTDYLQPTDMGLTHLPALTVLIEDEKDLRHGQAVEIEGATAAPGLDISNGLLARGYAEDGSLIGILRYESATNHWRPRKILS